MATENIRKESPPSSGFFSLLCYLVFASFLPLLVLHFRQLWVYDHYQYYPLILCCLPVLFSKLSVSPANDVLRRGGSGRAVALILLTSLILLLLAVVAWSPNLGAVSAVIAAGAGLHYLHGQGCLRKAMGVWLLLWTLVRLPLNLDLDLIFWLQGVTSELSSQLLDALNINHVLQGHVIRIPGDGFLVEEACSGIQSLFTLVAFTGVALLAVERSRLHSLALLVSAAFWACMINTIRVSTVVISKVWFSFDVASGWRHELLGILLFIVAILMIVSSDSLMRALVGGFSTRPRCQAATQVSPAAPPRVFLSWRRYFIAGFTILGIAQCSVLFLTARGQASIDADDPRLANAFSESSLPSKIGMWTRTEFRTERRSVTNYMGRNTASWGYESGQMKVLVAVDYPFLGWHELINCYEAQGCVVSDRRLKGKTVNCEVASPDGALGTLWYSEFTETGVPLSPLSNTAGAIRYWVSRIESSFQRQTASFRSNASTYQVQLLAYGTERLTPDQNFQLSQLHQETTQRLMDVIREATAE